jgi:hypothetical protein
MPLLHLEPLPQRAGKSDLLAFLESTGGLSRRHVGRIELGGRQATVEIPEGWQDRLVKSLDGQPLAGRRVRVWADSPPGSKAAGEDHFSRLSRLLELENKAEAKQTAQYAARLSPAEAERSGTTLVDLVIVDEDTGLGGHYLLQLAKHNRANLPWTRLNVGSPVALSAGTGRRSQGHHAVVCELTSTMVKVALGRVSDDLGDHDRWRLDLSSDEVAATRQKAALQRARSARGERLAELRDVLLGERPPAFHPVRDMKPLNTGLDATQREAVQFALSARDLALIHGPPGTGKTTAVVELIRQAVRRGDKVLACAPSNLAVDNIFERLIAAGEKTVRLGHPARVMPHLRRHTLDLLVDEHADVRLARKLVKEARGLFRKASRYTRARPAPGTKQEARREAKNLLDDARRLEAQAVEQILDRADILCATTTGLNTEILGTRRFDLAVVDEACQSTEPGCWIPLLWCDRVVLAGDHCQLPPTVVSQEAVKEGLGRSLFERCVEMAGPSIARRLSVQYRMHEAIMDFSSLEFYDGRLQADAAVREHLLAGLPGVKATPLTQTAVEFIDTAGASFDEQLEPDGESRLNRREAKLVCHKVGQLLDAGLSTLDIAVIAPYAAQVRLLREQLPTPELEIDSVDGFQGREKEAVIISLVRSNPRGEIGFLGDIRRMNVAMTRARRKLIVLGDSATLAGHPFYARMLEYFESLKAYHTVWEEDMHSG